jgi:hypothetical protein
VREAMMDDGFLLGTTEPKNKGRPDWPHSFFAISGTDTFFFLNVRSFVQACECNAIAVMPTKMLIATNIPHTVPSLTKHLIYIRVQSDASIIEW